MTKENLVCQVYRRLEERVPKYMVRMVVAELFKTMEETITTGDEKISIKGFGTFKTKTLKGRNGVDPRNKEHLDIAPRRMVKFTESENIRQFFKAESKKYQKRFGGK